jgi:hypothetical protein
MKPRRCSGQQQDADASRADQDGFVSKSAEIVFEGNNSLEDAPKPKQIRRRHVKRGFAWRKAKDPDVKLKAGEAVFVKEGSRYEKIGRVGSDRRTLPIAYIGEELTK